VFLAQLARGSFACRDLRRTVASWKMSGTSPRAVTSFVKLQQATVAREELVGGGRRMAEQPLRTPLDKPLSALFHTLVLADQLSAAFHPASQTTVAETPCMKRATSVAANDRAGITIASVSEVSVDLPAYLWRSSMSE
jgi:hypothetical protein